MKFAGSLSDCDKEKASYELIGIPFDGNSFKKGARKGPEAIRKASHRMESFLWTQKMELSDLRFYDYGNHFRKFFKQRFDKRKKIFIGGDHSITFPIVRHFIDHDEAIKVITIDAHADFRDVYRGRKFSNACIMRRIAELVEFENVMEIGTRSASEEEYEYMKDKIMVYDANMLRDKGIVGVLDEIEEEDSSKEKTYLSIDIDVLDPSIAPGVENPEPCGMSLEMLISLVRGIIERRNVITCDVTEVNPKLDGVNGITSVNAARIIVEILSCYAMDWRWGNKEVKHYGMP
jgi:agmatinase